MNITQEDVLRATDKLTVFLNFTDEKHLKFGQGLYVYLCEYLPRINYPQLEAVTKEVMRDMGRFAPAPKAFMTAYNKLASSYGWNIRTEEQKKCSAGCMDGWVFVTLMEQVSGKRDRFGKPCPKCRPNHPYQNLPAREGWLECFDDGEVEPVKLTEKQQAFVNELVEGKCRTDQPQHASIVSPFPTSPDPEPKVEETQCDPSEQKDW